MPLKVIVEGNKVSGRLEKALSQAKSVDGLELQVFSAPKDLAYTVPEPFVSYESETTSVRAYGEDAFSLIEDVASGKLR